MRSRGGVRPGVALSVAALASLTLAWSVVFGPLGWWARFGGVATSMGTLRVDAPASSSAGDAVAVQISGAHPAVDEATVVASATAGAVNLAAPLDRGRGTLWLPEGVTSSAGTITVWVVAGLDEAVAEVRVVAGPPVAPIVPLVGAKSIVADGADRAMVVGLPADRFGNPVENRGEVVVSLWRRGGSSEVHGVRRTGLIVWQWLRAGTEAGRDQVALRLGDADGPVADLDEVPGAPGSIALRVDEQPLVADGRALHEVTTDQLIDQHGNALLDGTAVRLLVETATGRQQATASTIGGRATFRLEAPSAPGPVRVVATAAGVVSDPLVLDFAAAVRTWPVRSAASAAGWVVDVGPVERTGGAWVPDGSEVVLRDGTTRRLAHLEAGRAHFQLRSRPSAAAEIQILGVVERLVP